MLYTHHPLPLVGSWELLGRSRDRVNVAILLCSHAMTRMSHYSSLKDGAPSQHFAFVIKKPQSLHLDFVLWIWFHDYVLSRCSSGNFSCFWSRDLVTKQKSHKNFSSVANLKMSRDVFATASVARKRFVQLYTKSTCLDKAQKTTTTTKPTRSVENCLLLKGKRN